MTLAPGIRLGPYEVTAQIGVGGMGEVYRATDTNLKRQVAIKVLPEALASDAERLARFQREAEVLAALNHPNIAAIYGLEKSDGTTALVMELVEGPTLADRIANGAVPIDEALPIAKQIAEALEAAHEQGIIHRDLKPANVKVRPDGTVKVLDFGLAKALEPAGVMSPGMSQAPTITTPAMTQAGMILGTAAYMSPEQAKGRTVDKRSDVWAFGAVLYEMLSGKRAFEGEDVSETLADVMRVEPAWGKLPDGLSPSLLTFLKCCLQKDSRQRLGDMHDMRLALEGAFETVASQPGDSPVASVVPRSAWWQALPLVAVALVAVLLTGLVTSGLRPAPESRSVVRSTHLLPDGRSFRASGRPVLAIAPDGGSFIYNGTGGLYLRAMDSLTDRLIPGTEANENATSPTFAPDGQSLAYFDGTDNRLKRIAVSGGAAMVLTTAVNPFGVSWEADSTILYGQPDGIWQVSENGGEPQHVIATEAPEQAHGPQRLPGGDWVLFTVTRGVGATRWDEAEIVVESPASGERRVLRTGGSDARYMPTGHLVYASQDVLYAMAFDVDRLEVTGGAVPVVQGVSRTAGADVTTGAAFYAVARDGTLVYVPGSGSSALRTLVWVDRAGQETGIDVPEENYSRPRVSPDGRRVAVEIARNGTRSIWVADTLRGSVSRVTGEAESAFAPVWTPDGQQLVYTGVRDGVEGFYRKLADGTGAEEHLAAVEGAAGLQAWNWSPDGKSLVFEMIRTDTQGDIGVLSLEAEPSWALLIATEASESNPSISPDGQWIAYRSLETGDNEVYLQRFPSLGDRQQVSAEGAVAPSWSPDGRALYYVPFRSVGGPQGLTVVTVDSGPPLSVGPPAALFSRSFLNAGGDGRNYDIAPDGERFLMLADPRRLDADGAATRQISQINIVQNWTEELKRLVPVN